MIAFYFVWIGFLLYAVLDRGPSIEEEDDRTPKGPNDIEARRKGGQRAQVEEEEDHTGKNKHKKKKSKKRKKEHQADVIKVMALLLVTLLGYIFSLHYMHGLGRKASLVVPTVAEIKQIKYDHAERIQARWQPSPPPPSIEQVPIQNTYVPLEPQPKLDMANVRSRIKNAIRKNKPKQP